MDDFDLRLWPEFKEAGGNVNFPAIINQIAIDSRRMTSKNSLFVALEGKKTDGHNYIPHAVNEGVKYVLAKKGWQIKQDLKDVSLLLVDDPLNAFQQIAKTYRKQMPCKIVLIAGSYGKTMVKDLLFDMLKSDYRVAASPESFNSQIGVPLSLLTIKKEHQLALIEAGISEKDEMEILSELIIADFSIITHIGRKHLATLGSLETTASEMIKTLLIPTQKEWSIIPKDPYLIPLIKNASCHIHFWDTESSHLPHAMCTSEKQGSEIPYQLHFPDGQIFSSSMTSGFYYFLDLINITSKAAWLLETPLESITRALGQYRPEPTRTEIWKSPTGTLFINDTYCSDPQSIERSFNDFLSDQGGKKIFIFGGIRIENARLRHAYSFIAKAILQAKISHLILFGPHDFEPLIEEIKSSSLFQPIITYCSQFSEALSSIKDNVHPGDAVLIKGKRKESIDDVMETFYDSICNNQCIINLATVGENIKTIRSKLNAKTRFMVMVKALAYGTNDIQMAKFLKTCDIDILGVSYVDEGVALKRAGVSQTIFVMNSALYEAKKIVKWELEIGVSDPIVVKAIAKEAFAQGKIIKLHLHVDTGMNRFGCRKEETLQLAQLILSFSCLKLEGIMTHFACAEDPNQDSFTLEQVARFDKVIKELQDNQITVPWRHAANSSGAIRFNFPQYNMIRIGLAVYGLYSSEATKTSLKLRLALSLISKVVGLNHCKQGETISYGRTYQVERKEQTIAVLPIGYFDGLHRHYSGKGFVIIRGHKAQMVGKICMDFMMVDVTDIPALEVGDTALIFGEDEHGHYASAEELALSSNTIIHELITCLGPRIQRLFIYEEALAADEKPNNPRNGN